MFLISHEIKHPNPTGIFSVNKTKRKFLKSWVISCFLYTKRRAKSKYGNVLVNIIVRNHQKKRNFRPMSQYVRNGQVSPDRSRELFMPMWFFRPGPKVFFSNIIHGISTYLSAICRNTDHKLQFMDDQENQGILCLKFTDMAFL